MQCQFCASFANEDCRRRSCFLCPPEHIVQLVDDCDIRQIIFELPEQSKTMASEQRELQVLVCVRRLQSVAGKGLFKKHFAARVETARGKTLNQEAVNPSQCLHSSKECNHPDKFISVFFLSAKKGKTFESEHYRKPKITCYPF